jgi:predicted DNA-binding transcriptional regulator AlpA
VYVNYRYLEERKIVTNRMCLARAIERYNFPQPIEMGANRLAWDLAEVEAWLAARPRRSPKSGDKRSKQAPSESASVAEA